MIEQQTIRYKTYLKKAMVEAMRRSFSDHVDEILTKTKVSIEFPHEENTYPAVLVKYYERSVQNMGVGHEEILKVNNLDFKFRHYRFDGDIEFAIHALSSLDRDLISDSIVQIIAMGTLEEWTNHFHDRVYGDAFLDSPFPYNQIELNTDELKGFGETQIPAPWLAEDTFVYQVGHRIQVAGGFYSLPPDVDRSLVYIEDVDQYPYRENLEPIPTGADDPAEWVPPLD